MKLAVLLLSILVVTSLTQAADIVSARLEVRSSCIMVISITCSIDKWRMTTKQVTIGKNILINIVWDHVMLFR